MSSTMLEYRQELLLHKKQISPRMNTDDTDLQIQNGSILHFLIRVISVIGVIRGKV